MDPHPNPKEALRVEYIYNADDMRELFAVAGKNKPLKAKAVFRRNLILGTVIGTAFLWMLWLNAKAGPLGTAHFPRHWSDMTSDMVFPAFVVAASIVVGVVTWIVNRTIRPGQALKKQGLIDLLLACDFTPDGVTVNAPTFETRWKWDAFDRCIETPERFFLRLNEKVMYVMIPKRVLQNPTDVAELREMFAVHIGAKTSAFPVLPATPSAT